MYLALLHEPQLAVHQFVDVISQLGILPICLAGEIAGMPSFDVAGSDSLD